MIVDSQSVKTTARELMRLGWGQAGLGRKRWLAVDGAGLIHVAAVCAVDVPECEGGRELLRQAVEAGRLRQVAVVWADGGYAGGFEAWVRARLGWRLEVVRRRGRAFAVLPRW
ncbi:MAG: hypothetical protein NZ532_03925 [Thermoflexales bacterium]|nr:hypothetical protein [Thermoflexales bacterium]